jgi:hypothetical protein
MHAVINEIRVTSTIKVFRRLYSYNVSDKI